MHNEMILVSGASGYIGGRLIPALLEKKYSVKALIREHEDLSDRGWNSVSFYKGDVMSIDSLREPMRGVDTAYYLIHSMAEGKDFIEKDKLAAANFAAAAKDAGVRRIIYLSGLGNDAGLSEHLKSRQQTGRVLGSTGIAVTEFRAAQVIGSGSISFEMIRYLTERLPIILSPQWITSLTQPIGVSDVIYYLTEALQVAETSGKIIEIGGADVVSYKDLILLYAKIRGLHRPFFRLPFLSPAFFAFWVNLITPIPRNIAKPLLEGIKNDVVITDCGADQFFTYQPMSLKQAIEQALSEHRLDKVSTFWSIPQSQADCDRVSDPVTLQKEGLFIEQVSVSTELSADALYKKMICIGGDYGWPSFRFLWSLRGYLDQLFGGAGKVRGRRCMFELRPGDPLDFFTVEKVEPNKRLLLKTDLKMPGDGWLEFVIDEQGSYRRLTLRAYFDPKGTGGLLYWKALLPFHAILFKSTLEKITKE